MKLIISGTNRPNSRSLQVSQLVQNLYQQEGEKVELLDLSQMPYEELTGSQYGSKNMAGVWGEAITKVNKADGLVIVVPEYNGSMPGALKYFIDHWIYPESFEARPVCFIGLGGTFGGLRPVEHLQQVFNYRNGYVFPMRIFMFNVWNILKDGKITDANLSQLLHQQVVGFQKFVKALKSEKLDANSLPPKTS